MWCLPLLSGNEIDSVNRSYLRKGVLGQYVRGRDTSSRDAGWRLTASSLFA
jgi:hypothetical protein